MADRGKANVKRGRGKRGGCIPMEGQSEIILTNESNAILLSSVKAAPMDQYIAKIKIHSKTLLSVISLLFVKIILNISIKFQEENVWKINYPISINMIH